MNLYDFAKSELKLLNPNNDEMQDWVTEHVLKIVEVFQEGGHSGFTAGYTIALLERVLRFMPLSPLTGEDDEWNEVFDGVEQNKRRSSVFRENKDNSTAHDIDGKIFSRDNGVTWFTSRDSRKLVVFPYYPPTRPEEVYLDKEE